MSLHRYLLFLLLLPLALSGQDTKPANRVSRDIQVIVTGGGGMYFADFSCLNSWFKYYNYPELPSGSLSGYGSISWQQERGLRVSLAVSRSVSGKQSRGGYVTGYSTGALSVRAGYSLLHLGNWSLIPVGMVEFRNAGVRLERNLPSTVTLDDLLAGTGGFARNTGALLQKSGRNLGGGLQLEWDEGKGVVAGFTVAGTTGNRSRWELNDQFLPDSPRYGLRGIITEAYLGFRLHTIRSVTRTNN